MLSILIREFEIKNKVVLDLGCRSSFHSLLLAKNGNKATAMDRD